MRLSKSFAALVMFSAAIGFAQTCHVDTAKATATNANVEKSKGLKPQTTCPVMTGQPIDKSFYADYKGKRIYVCCGDCLAKLKKNPEKYLKKLHTMGQEAGTIKSGPAQAGKDTVQRK